jgi:hypothetical protein
VAPDPTRALAYARQVRDYALAALLARRLLDERHPAKCVVRRLDRALASRTE